jgi:hypothetical protein
MAKEVVWWRELAAYNAGVMALVGGGGALLIALFNSGEGDTLPLFATGPGQPNFAAVLVLIASVMGAVVTSYSYRGLFLARKEDREIQRLAEEPRGRSMLLRFFAALGVGALFLFSLALVFYVVSGSRQGSMLNRALAIAVATLFGGLLSYVTAYWVITVRPRQLFRLALALLVISLIMGMASVTSPNWWRNTLGFFGYSTLAELVVAFGVLIGCLVVLAVAMDIMSDLRVIVDIGGLDLATFDRLKFGLYAVTLGMAGIGLFPTYADPADNPWLAVAVIVMTLLMIIGFFASPWLMPGYGKPFHALSLAAGVTAVGALLAWLAAGWITFPGLEMLLLAIALVWVFCYQYLTTRFVLAQRPALRAAAAALQPEASTKA